MKKGNVKKTTRTGIYGKMIICPECQTEAKVYHFGWSALGCQNKECGKMIKKLDWGLK